MIRAGELGRFHLLNPRVMIAGNHAVFAAICFLRPNLDTIFRAYSPFGNITAWGVGLGALAIVLLLAQRASLLLMIAQLVSSVALFTIGGLLTLGVGLLPTAGMAAWFGLCSLVLFARTFSQWLETQTWYWAWRARPPRWLARRTWFRQLQQRAGGGSG